MKRKGFAGLLIVLLTASFIGGCGDDDDDNDADGGGDSDTDTDTDTDTDSDADTDTDSDTDTDTDGDTDADTDSDSDTDTDTDTDADTDTDSDSDTDTDAITVTAPNGGESWVVGENYDITWSTIGTVGNVNIAYSTDGATFTDIATGETNDGIYTWTIPDDISTTVTVRVQEADGDPTDTSDADFEISGPTLTVTAPNGGEAWVVGMNHDITWSTEGTVGNVDIAYSTDGTSYTDISLGETNDGTYSWTVPDDLSTTVTVRVQEADADPADTSDADFTIYTGIYYVNGSVPGGDDNGLDWTNAFDDLQEALAVAQDGAEIWVAAGTYKPAGPGGSITASFALIDGVEVYGGFAGTESLCSERNWNANVTTLSGDLDGDDTDEGLTVGGSNTEHVVTGADNAVLDGFTIIGGNIQTTGQGGGGMFNNACSPTVANCTFTGNHAHRGGGMYNLNASPTVTDCEFRKNTAAIGDLGGGICNEGASAAPHISGCYFERNSAGAGGGIYNYGVANGTTIDFCTFYWNTSASGAGIHNNECSPTVTNCTFAYNGSESPASAAGIYNRHASPTVTNCIFWGNRNLYIDNTTQILNSGASSNPTFTSCCIEGGLTTGVVNQLEASHIDGGDNISGDPDFVNTPAWVDYTQAQGTTTRIEVDDTSYYDPPEQVFYLGTLNDLEMSVSTIVDSTTISFFPSTTTTHTRQGQIIMVFGPGETVVDWNLQSSSPCINAGTGGLDIGAYPYP